MISVRELVFSYPGSTETTLKGLDFEIAEQEVFGFLGPSGAGKSTTQNLLIGLLRDYNGSIQVMDREITSWKQDYFEEVGVSFELPNHFLKLSALENLRFFGSLYRNAALTPMEALERVGLQDEADKKVAAYSKGMKIRLNLARSLMHKPKILFLDEPTGGLDPANARRIKDLILELRKEGATIFVTTHDMAVADELCDRVAFLADGSIRELDAPETLRRRHGRRTLRVEYIDDAGEPGEREFELEALGENAAFASLLKSVKRIESMHTLEASLEEVFIEVTGQELRA